MPRTKTVPTSKKAMMVTFPLSPGDHSDAVLSVGGDMLLDWNTLSFMKIRDDTFWLDSMTMRTFVNAVNLHHKNSVYHSGHQEADKLFDYNTMELGGEDQDKRKETFQGISKLCLILACGPPHSAHYIVAVFDKENEQVTLFDPRTALFSRFSSSITNHQKDVITKALKSFGWVSSGVAPEFVFRRPSRQQRHPKWFIKIVVVGGEGYNIGNCGPVACLIYNNIIKAPENHDLERMAEGVPVVSSATRLELVTIMKDNLGSLIEREVSKKTLSEIDEKRMQLTRKLLKLGKFEEYTEPETNTCVCAHDDQEYMFFMSCCGVRFHPCCYMKYLLSKQFVYELDASEPKLMCCYCNIDMSDTSTTQDIGILNRKTLCVEDVVTFPLGQDTRGLYEKVSEVAQKYDPGKIYGLMDVPSNHPDRRTDNSSERCKTWYVIKEGNIITRIGKTRLGMRDIIKTEVNHGSGDIIVITDGGYKAVTPDVVDLVDTPDNEAWRYSIAVQRGAARSAAIERERLNSRELRRTLLSPSEVGVGSSSSSSSSSSSGCSLFGVESGGEDVNDAEYVDDAEDVGGVEDVNDAEEDVDDAEEDVDDAEDVNDAEDVGGVEDMGDAEDSGVGEYFPRVDGLEEYRYQKMFDFGSKSAFIFRFGSMLFCTGTREEGSNMNECFRNMFKEPKNAKLRCVCQQPFESMIPLLFHVQHRCEVAIPCDLGDFVMQNTPIAYRINGAVQKVLVAMNKIFRGGEKLDILDPTAAPYGRHVDDRVKLEMNYERTSFNQFLEKMKNIGDDETGVLAGRKLFSALIERKLKWIENHENEAYRHTLPDIIHCPFFISLNEVIVRVKNYN